MLRSRVTLLACFDPLMPHHEIDGHILPRTSMVYLCMPRTQKSGYGAAVWLL